MLTVLTEALSCLPHAGAAGVIIAPGDADRIQGREVRVGGLGGGGEVRMGRRRRRGRIHETETALLLNFCHVSTKAAEVLQATSLRYRAPIVHLLKPVCTAVFTDCSAGCKPAGFQQV